MQWIVTIHKELVTNRGKYGTMLWSGAIHQQCMQGLKLCRLGNNGHWCKKYGLWFGYYKVALQCYSTMSYNVLFLCSGVFQSIVGWCEILGPLNAVMCQIPDIARGRLGTKSLFCTVKCFMQLPPIIVQIVTLKCNLHLLHFKIFIAVQCIDMKQSCQHCRWAFITLQ